MFSHFYIDFQGNVSNIIDQLFCIFLKPI